MKILVLITLITLLFAHLTEMPVFKLDDIESPSFQE